MKKLLLVSACLISAAPASVSAASIIGSFSLVSFGGSYVGGSAATATGLDFGTVFGSTGNGYGTNGTALVGNATGSFLALDQSIASIADIALGATADPYTTNPFISFGSSPYTVSFTNAALTRSPLGTSVTITGNALFSDGVDVADGIFSLATSSQNGSSSNVNFTFSSNASTTAVPEPATWAMFIGGFGMIGGAMRRRSKATVRVAYAA